MFDNFSLDNDGIHRKFLLEEAGAGLLKPVHQSVHFLCGGSQDYREEPVEEQSLPEVL